jgi:subtilisin-like proprotein convertase family protein
MLVHLLAVMGCTLGLQPLTGVADPTDTADTGVVLPPPDCDDLDRDQDGFSTCELDCDDDDAATFPGAASNDNLNACMTDLDGDGYGAVSPQAGVRVGTDCDDSSIDIYPGATEVAFDGIDQDCDGKDSGEIITVNGEGNLPIQDYDTITSEATVTDCPGIIDATVNLEISHSFVGDLEVVLYSPSGFSFILHNRSGGSAANLIGSYSTSGGSLTPAQPLTPLSGSSGDGIWQLTVYDAAIGDSGTLNSWSLELSCL